MLRREVVGAALCGAMVFLGPSTGLAQGERFGVSFARWWHGGTADLYTASFLHPMLGPVDVGVGAFYLDDSRSAADDRSLSGGDLSLGIGRDGTGPYLVGSTGIGVRHHGGGVDASWSAGAGYAVRLLGFLSAGIEGRYRVEDSGLRGFWQLDPGDHRGFLLQAGVSLGSFGSRRATPPRATPREPGFPPAEPVTPTGSEPSEESRRLATEVVRTALDAMGAPYRWGGSETDGYDCSGLIQWAYGQHGILLPRTSRDQARLGVQVDPRTEALRPGDILGFAETGSGITHVGLYTGDGQFIHSSSTGVRLSSLIATDPDSRWWQQRWVVARRILN